MAAIALRVVANCDDVHLAWMPDRDIPGCLGFALRRKRNGGAPETLKNRVGFNAVPEEDYEPRPSTVWPFQRLDWTDHGANTGDTVEYQVVAMTGAPDALQEGPASDWSARMTLAADCGNGMAAYFNRGVVLSQFVGRILRERHWGPGDIKKHAGMLHDALREFLGGDLRAALLDMLNEAARDEKVEVHAALFELNDPELSSKLEFLGPRLRIVLGNGAVKTKTADENADIRARLVSAGAEVNNRMTAPTFLAHNKFVVLSRDDKPYKVLSGSTNWQPTGLCTQVNNAIVVENADIAADYLAAWQRLKDAGNGHPKKFKDTNSVAPAARRLGSSASAFVRFTATSDTVDLRELSDLIANARHNIFFEMFAPGTDLFAQVADRSKELYVRGVVNTIPNPGDADSSVDVSLVDGRGRQGFRLAVIEPGGIGHAFAYWAAEVTKRQFSAIGHAIVHSKVLVLDAWTQNPVVVTGSHNFSNSASKSNDENYLVVSGNPALAEAYAVNCLAVYDHYRWRKYVSDSIAAGKKPWSHLSTQADWLSRYRQSPERKTMLDFWFGR